MEMPPLWGQCRNQQPIWQPVPRLAPLFTARYPKEVVKAPFQGPEDSSQAPTFNCRNHCRMHIPGGYDAQDGPSDRTIKLLDLECLIQPQGSIEALD